MITADSLNGQREFSLRTFGPGERTKGVLEHIRSELDEIEADPSDIYEWIDVIILAFDGAFRQGFEPQEILDAYHSKIAKNRARAWPDWREFSQDEPIQHDRTHD